MLKLILIIITTALVSCLITSLFFYCKIFRRFSCFLKEENRKRDIEMGYVESELKEKSEVKEDGEGK